MRPYAHSRVPKSAKRSSLTPCGPLSIQTLQQNSPKFPQNVLFTCLITSLLLSVHCSVTCALSSHLLVAVCEGRLGWRGVGDGGRWLLTQGWGPFGTGDWSRGANNKLHRCVQDLRALIRLAQRKGRGGGKGVEGEQGGGEENGERGLAIF